VCASGYTRLNGNGYTYFNICAYPDFNAKTNENASSNTRAYFCHYRLAIST
jgi:hypothetical protein